MMYSVTLDGLSGFAFVIYGALTFAILTPPIILSETVVLWGLAWGSAGRSLLASLVMNVASTAAGIVVTLFAPLLLLGGGIWGVGLTTWILSVLVEGGVLRLMNQGAERRNWLAAIAANLVSYTIAIVLLKVLGVF